MKSDSGDRIDLLLQPGACDRCERDLSEPDSVTLWTQVAYIQFGMCFCIPCTRALNAMDAEKRSAEFERATIRRGARQDPEWGKAVATILEAKRISGMVIDHVAAYGYDPRC